MKAAIIWGVLAAVFTVLEIATVQVVSIWFAIGSVASLIASLLGAGEAVQLVIFVGVSVVALLLTRPFVKRFSANKIQATNADMCIGKEAVVTGVINNRLGEGSVKVGGIEWTARSQSEEEISDGEIVIVKKIEGVKLIVEKKS